MTPPVRSRPHPALAPALDLPACEGPRPEGRRPTGAPDVLHQTGHLGDEGDH